MPGTFAPCTDLHHRYRLLLGYSEAAQQGKKVMRFTRTPLITSLMILAQDKCNTLQLLNIPYGRKKCYIWRQEDLSTFEASLNGTRGEIEKLAR